jgi:hypothetical protein
MLSGKDGGGWFSWMAAGVSNRGGGSLLLRDEARVEAGDSLDRLTDVLDMFQWCEGQ